MHKQNTFQADAVKLLRIRKEALTGSPGQQLTSAQALVASIWNIVPEATEIKLRKDLHASPTKPRLRTCAEMDETPSGKHDWSTDLTKPGAIQVEISEVITNARKKLLQQEKTYLEKQICNDG